MAGDVSILEEHLWVLKQEEWTVPLQIMQGTGLELPLKTFLQSSQQGWPGDLGVVVWESARRALW